MTDQPTAADEAIQDHPAPGPIPTDEVGLYGFISKLPRTDRWLVAAWLKKQEDGRDYTDLVDRVTEEVVNTECITTSRVALVTALDQARNAIRNVLRVREELVVLFDVEHAEGGDLFPHYLAQADYAIRTAIAVNPTKS